jgi:uncharacterized membrane protein YqaE (UPF0057 family)
MPAEKKKNYLKIIYSLLVYYDSGTLNNSRLINLLMTVFIYLIAMAGNISRNQIADCTG